MNPEGHDGLSALGPVAVVGMAALSLTMIGTALGVIARRRWAWRIAVIGIVINAISDLATAVITGQPRTLIGLPIAGLIVWWLTRREVRGQFR